MDLLRLNMTTYFPEDLIEGYSSLIWTLRYQEPGEFELKTPRVEETMLALPLGSLVALSENEEMMFVENYTVDQSDDGEAILTVSGRSFTSFLENRIALDAYDWYYNYEIEGTGTASKSVEAGVHAWLLAPGATAWNDADAARHIIEQHLVVGVFTGPAGQNPEKIPNLIVTNQDTTNRRYYARYVQRGDLLEATLDIIKASGNGIRAVRPSSGGTVINVVLYGGVNRTNEQSTNARVVLDANQGHLSNVNYFMSIKGYRNSARVYPTRRHPYPNPVWDPVTGATTDPGRFGFNYRDLLVDATDITGISWEETDAASRARINTELAKNAKANVMSGKVSPYIPYRFGAEYYLGDLVTLRGNFNINQHMRITEYVKVEDESGEIGYPGLSVIT